MINIYIFITITKVMIFICLFFIVYIIAREIYKLFNKKIIEAQNKYNVTKLQMKKIEKNFYKNEKYKGIFEKTEIKLKKQGNPLKLTPISYYALKFGLTAICLIVTIKFRSDNVLNFIKGIGISVGAYFVIDAIYYFSNKDDKEKILADLPDICDVLDIQTSAGVNLGLALTEVYDIAKLKRFKGSLIKLAAEINITKNPERALDNFLSEYDLLELESFGLAIKQAIKTGKTKEILGNQSEVLKQNNIFAIQRETKKLITYMMVVGILIFCATISIVTFSFGMQISDSLNGIF